MIEVLIEGEARLEARFSKVVPSVRVKLKATIERLAIKLTGVVKKDYLSGQALNVGTGRLRRSINEKTTQTDSETFAVVGPNMEDAKYAAFHEFGFHGTESVRAHLRTITQAFGRPIPSTQVSVNAFTRKVDYNGRPFMRPAFQGMKQEILSSIQKAVEGNK